MRPLLFCLWCCVVIGCKPTSSKSDASVDAAISDVPDASAAPPVVSIADGGFTLTNVPPVEARRSRIARLSELKGLVDPFTKHFTADGGALAPAFDVQQAELTAAGRRAVLVMEANRPTTTAARPFLVIADSDDHVVWSRRPVGGIMPPVGPIAVAAAPAGHTALAACDPPTNLVALRIFDDDGSPFADFQTMSIDGCEAISLLFWPSHGWVIVVVREGATRALLVTEDGAPAWKAPLDVGARSRASAIAPANLAADTNDSFVIVQIVQPTALSGSPFHALAFRYDRKGKALWPAAVDLGETEKIDRVRVTSLRPGVSIALGSRQVDLKPNGELAPR